MLDILLNLSRIIHFNICNSIFKPHKYIIRAQIQIFTIVSPKVIIQEKTVLQIRPTFIYQFHLKCATTNVPWVNIPCQIFIVSAVNIVPVFLIVSNAIPTDAQMTTTSTIQHLHVFFVTPK